MPSHPLTAAMLLAFAGSSLAQDMIAVSWSGGLLALDSYTGQVTPLGSGLFGQNAIARDGLGALWSSTRTAAQPYVYDLTRIDPATATATPVILNGPDVRGLASTGTHVLYAIVNAPTGTADSFALIDTILQTTTIVGPTGMGSIQALTLKDGVLFAWDLTAGLMTIDPTTGVATDVGPTGSSGANLQWLAVRSDGALVGGNTTLYTVDPATGVPTAIAAGLGDLRGAEPWQSATHAFGSGCNGGAGPITLSASLTPQPAAVLSLQSSNHQASAIGLLLIGFGNTSFGALPLPLSLDPLFGTVGCSLYTTLDITALGTTTSSPPATMSFAIPLPPVLDVFTFYAQHLALENVPGGMSTSNAIAVQVGP